MNQITDVVREVSLAEGEQILTNYAEWQSKRGLSGVAIAAAIILIVLCFAVKVAQLALVVLAGFGIYILYQYFIKSVESGCVIRTNHRLIVFLQRRGSFLNTFTVDAVRLDTVVGVNTFGQASLLLKGGDRVGIGADIGEQVFSDVLETRYSQ